MDIYRPQTKLRKGYVFAPVCHSVHGGGCPGPGTGGVSAQGGCPGPGPGGAQAQGCVSHHALRQTPPSSADVYCCGRYASYLNAFLLFLSLLFAKLMTFNFTKYSYL